MFKLVCEACFADVEQPEGSGEQSRNPERTEIAMHCP